MRHYLSEGAKKELKALGQTQIVVGIPSRNTAETIANVIFQAEKGLKKYFPRKKSLIIVSDSSGINSETYKEIEKAKKEIETPLVLIETEKGKGNQICQLLLATQAVNAEVLCLFDSDLKSITPEWVKNIIEPILSKQLDFVTPNYIRHKYDGTITNSIVYPLTTALYGREIRQPIGGDFGLSKALVKYCLKSNLWIKEVGFFGIDIWFTTLALYKFKRIAQANLGVKIHDASVKDPKYPEKNIGSMFEQVIGTMFFLAEKFDKKWENVSEVYHTPFYGPEINLEPQKVSLNFDYLFEATKRTAQKELFFWKSELDEKMFSKLNKILNQDKKSFSLPQDFWVDIIYEFLLLYRKKKKLPEKRRVISSLLPIYLAYVTSFSREARDYTNEEADAKFKDLIRLFLEKKERFTKKWEEEEKTFTGLYIRKRVKEIIGLR